MILINEKEFFSNFLFNDLLKMSNDLKKLQKYENSDFVKNLSTYCDVYINAILDEPYSKTIKLNSECVDLFLIEKETINRLSYNELKFFNYMYYVLYKNEPCNIYLYELKVSEKNLLEKESIIRNGLYDLETLTLEQFQILIELVSTSSLEWYAIDCGVEVEELTPEVMYQKYHKDNILKRC